MEPITHFLTGACLGRAGFNRKTALATATMTLAAEAPDLDIFGSFKGPVFGFGHHRGFTHSFLGLVLVSALVVGFVYLIWRLRGRKIKDPNLPPRWGLLFGLAYLAGLTHILLDFTNNYGVRPFWPFSERWYSWDIVFIADPVILGLLVGGLVLPALFALIDRELGVRSRGPRGRWGAIAALAGLLVVWGVRDYEHRRAVNALEARTYEGANPIRVSAYPYWWSPFHWSGVVEAQNFFAIMTVESLTPEVDPSGDMQVIYKPEETPVTSGGEEFVSRPGLSGLGTVSVHRDRAGPEGYVVRFRDLRYAYPDQSRTGLLGASVELDRDLKVTGERFGSRKR